MNLFQRIASWFKPAQPIPSIQRLSYPPSSLANEIAEIAKAEVGVHETNGSNCGPRVNLYKAATNLPPKQAWPWCAAFVCWCVREATKGRGFHFTLPTTAGAWAFEEWARKQPAASVSFKKPHASDIRKGDIVVFTFSHIGIAMGPPVGGLVPTCEGNTDGSGSRDGGEVAIRTRKLATIRSRIRLT